MKRWISLLAILTIAVGVVMHDTSRGQVPTTRPDVGPGAGGATLKLPGYDSTPAANTNNDKPALPDYLKNFGNAGAGAYPSVKPGATKIALPPSNQVDINKDIEITPAAGQWMIFAMAYTGPKAPEMARRFVAVMRGHYKWNAYVFNYGANEKRAEYERVEKLRQEQIEALKKAGLNADVPFRVPVMKIDEQTGVLVGGYNSREDAMTALKKLRLLDPKALVDNKVDLDTKYVVELDGKERREATYVNPFTKAFPARNPTTSAELANVNPDEELKFLNHVNSAEPFSLLQCKKPFTLAIKQFNMQYRTMDNKKQVKDFLEKFEKGFLLKGGIFQKSDGWEDIAANNAHKLAEACRKTGLPDTYVLHCKHCSFVTVGNYDKIDDPRLLAMQNYLETRFKADAYRPLELFPRPVPMPVPGIVAPKNDINARAY